jgi:hypothetical protein
MWGNEKRSLCKLEMPIDVILNNLPNLGLDKPVLSRYDGGSVILRKEYDCIGYAVSGILTEINSENNVGDVYYISNLDTVDKSEFAIIRIA